MERWAGEANLNDLYLTALGDQSERVRRSALMALIDTPYRTDAVYQALVSVVEDENVDPLTRENALYGLEKYNLSPEDKQRFKDMIAGRQ